uniref:Uncharacterized protein n=1 Tax=Daucus carota subsp. sativus TaxID=79200 RepID=A0A166I562_DAUCS
MAEVDDSPLNAVNSSTDKLDGDPTGKLNGVTFDDEEEHSSQSKPNPHDDQITLYAVFNNVTNRIFFPRHDDQLDLSTGLLHRIKTTASENWPLLPEASRNTVRHVLLWTQRGSALRSLLVVSWLGLLHTGCLRKIKIVTGDIATSNLGLFVTAIYL